MKSRLLLIPALLGATAAMAGPLDAHEQAAALLSRPHEASYDVVGPASSAATFKDAHESAAALLGGSRPGSAMSIKARVSSIPVERMSVDAHAQAAALLHKG
jgi:hypothetical protein